MRVSNVLAGVLAGIAIGILIAPAKGSETRQKISDKADDLKSRLKHLKDHGGEDLGELKEAFNHEIIGLKDDIREKILRLIDASKKTYRQMKGEASHN
jgi:gas vesicle protein